MRYLGFLLLIFMIFGAQKSAAQQFTVESYRELTNDVSGFITPVRDSRNGHGRVRLSDNPDSRANQ